MKVIKTLGLSIMLTVTIYCFMGLPFMEAQVRNNLIGIIVLGAVIGSLSLLYDTDLPLLMVSLIHGFGSLGTFLAVAYFGKWFPFGFGVVAGSAGLFLLIFLLVWSVFYLGEKRKIDKINEKLN